MDSKVEKAAALYNRMLSILNHMEDQANKERIEAMLADIQYQLASTPASTQTQYGGAYPGGLLHYCVLSATILKKLSDASSKLPVDDIVIAGLFHHLGKIGYPESPLFIEKKSDWHNKNGIMYETNKDYVGSGINHNFTSLWYLSKYGISISPRAFETISSMNTKPSGQMDEFTNNELTILLLAASRLAWKKLAIEDIM